MCVNHGEGILCMIEGNYVDSKRTDRIHQFLIGLSNQWFYNNGKVAVNPYDM